MTSPQGIAQRRPHCPARPGPGLCVLGGAADRGLGMAFQSIRQGPATSHQRCPDPLTVGRAAGETPLAGSTARSTAGSSVCTMGLLSHPTAQTDVAQPFPDLELHV